MNAKYSTINSAWIVLFGDMIEDICGQRFFSSRKELEKALKSCGLEMTRNGQIILAA